MLVATMPRFSTAKTRLFSGVPVSSGGLNQLFESGFGESCLTMRRKIWFLALCGILVAGYWHWRGPLFQSGHKAAKKNSWLGADMAGNSAGGTLSGNLRGPSGPVTLEVDRAWSSVGGRFRVQVRMQGQTAPEASGQWYLHVNPAKQTRVIRIARNDYLVSCFRPGRYEFVVTNKSSGIKMKHRVFVGPTPCRVVVEHPVDGTTLKATEQGFVSVSGHVEGVAGCAVKLNGRPVELDANTSFHTKLRCREGLTVLRFLAYAPAGPKMRKIVSFNWLPDEHVQGRISLVFSWQLLNSLAQTVLANINLATLLPHPLMQKKYLLKSFSLKADATKVALGEIRLQLGAQRGNSRTMRIRLAVQDSTTVEGKYHVSVLGKHKFATHIQSIEVDARYQVSIAGNRVSVQAATPPTVEVGGVRTELDYLPDKLAPALATVVRDNLVNALPKLLRTVAEQLVHIDWKDRLSGLGSFGKIVGGPLLMSLGFWPEGIDFQFLVGDENSSGNRTGSTTGVIARPLPQGFSLKSGYIALVVDQGAFALFAQRWWKSGRLSKHWEFGTKRHATPVRIPILPKGDGLLKLVLRPLLDGVSQFLPAGLSVKDGVLRMVIPPVHIELAVDFRLPPVVEIATGKLRFHVGAVSFAAFLSSPWGQLSIQGNMAAQGALKFAQQGDVVVITPRLSSVSVDVDRISPPVVSPERVDEICEKFLTRKHPMELLSHFLPTWRIRLSTQRIPIPSALGEYGLPAKLSLKRWRVDFLDKTLVGSVYVGTN